MRDIPCSALSDTCTSDSSSYGSSLYSDGSDTGDTAYSDTHPERDGDEHGNGDGGDGKSSSVQAELMSVSSDTGSSCSSDYNSGSSRSGSGSEWAVYRSSVSTTDEADRRGQTKTNSLCELVHPM
jgi:hypothetical protein